MALSFAGGGNVDQINTENKKMNSTPLQETAVFFSGIDAWRAAYHRAHLHYVAREEHGQLLLIVARLVLDVAPDATAAAVHRAGPFQAGHVDLSAALSTIEHSVTALLSDAGLTVPGHGCLRLQAPVDGQIRCSEPTFRQVEGVNNIARRMSMTALGISQHEVVGDDSHWTLRGGELPFDTLHELAQEYELDLGDGRHTRLTIEAHNAVRVFAGSAIFGDSASLGIWTAKTLDRSRLRLGYRILAEEQVLQRYSLSGTALQWSEAGVAAVGRVEIPIYQGASVQCYASYDGRAYHQQWIAPAQ